MMVAQVQRAAIHGATISLLLQSVTCAGGRDFDGLLLGRFQTHTETRFEDECSGRHAWHSPMHALQVVFESRAVICVAADAIVVEQHHALVTGVVCSATSCSFYDASGAITGEQMLRPACLRGHGYNSCLLLALFADSSTEEQLQALVPTGCQDQVIGVRCASSGQTAPQSVLSTWCAMA